MSGGMFAVCGAYGMLELEVFCRAAALRADGSLKYEMRVLERPDSKLGCHSPFKMSDDASLFCLYCLGITPPGIQISACSGFCLLAARFMGGFWAFNVSRRIPISTFGHSNACRQSRRTDCGLSHVCLRSSAAYAFCGVLCVLDGFVLKCPKVETIYLDGVKIPGSVILVVCEVHYVARWVRFYGARSPFWPCSASSCFACRGATIIFTRAGGDDQIYLRGSDEQICPWRANKKDAPKGALHANKFPRRGAPRLRRQCA